jgi:hypothetical protein
MKGHGTLVHGVSDHPETALFKAHVSEVIDALAISSDGRKKSFMEFSLLCAARLFFIRYKPPGAPVDAVPKINMMTSNQSMKPTAPN